MPVVFLYLLASPLSPRQEIAALALHIASVRSDLRFRMAAMLDWSKSSFHDTMKAQSLIVNVNLETQHAMIALRRIKKGNI